MAMEHASKSPAAKGSDASKAITLPPTKAPAGSSSGNRAEYVGREAILALLSDVEVGRLSNAESAASLPADEEFIDLEKPELGVQRGLKGTPMGEILPRRAVGKETWGKNR